MIRKNISDRANVSASVILNRKGEHVANVAFLYAKSGGVSCEVRNYGDAVLRCLDVALKSGRVSAKALEKLESEAKYCTTPESRREYAARELFSVQSGHAGGYGYDKTTASLSGLLIDGHSMANHCGHVVEDEKRREKLWREYCKAHDTPGGNTDGEYWRKRADALGCHFANWCQTENDAIAEMMQRHKITRTEAGEMVTRRDRPPLCGRFTSLYFRSGLERLGAFGYRVISAI